eukprot:CAMPEP_0114554950 /NCGR_PEP_ID=MMETSP0114-20121206/8486_1 /TAXON_ID=31324 /ORGANISM="Goniomonas sp, Strain m" /LENGTH=151 /DNA_ID=CAMNT_0001740037 /DNA_START=22 /DNA_END=477 /DNA_ORIENTATION=-
MNQAKIGGLLLVLVGCLVVASQLPASDDQDFETMLAGAPAPAAAAKPAAAAPAAKPAASAAAASTATGSKAGASAASAGAGSKASGSGSSSGSGSGSSGSKNEELSDARMGAVMVICFVGIIAIGLLVQKQNSQKQDVASSGDGKNYGTAQ